MTFVKDWGPGAIAGSTCVVTLDSAVPVGASIIVIASGKAAVTALTTDSAVTDSKGNTYVTDNARTNDSISAVVMVHGVITTALASGDTITFTPSSAQSKLALQVSHFTDKITSVDGKDGYFLAGNQSALDAGTVASNDASALYVGGWFLSNTGRVFTPAVGFSAGTKYISTTGTGDTAVFNAYRFGSGSQHITGSLDSAGLTCATSTAYGLDSVAAPLATPAVSVSKTDPTTNGGTDGSITATWPAVPGAVNYKVGKLPGSVTSGVDPAESTQSGLSKTWTGQAAGTQTVTVQAI